MRQATCVLCYSVLVRKRKTLDPVTFFSALADLTRLRLINLLRDEEVCVCFFVEVLGTNQPKISRHLAYLRRAGLASARRDGKWIHYRLIRPEDPYFERIFDDVLGWLENDPGMQRDRDALIRACCSTRAPEQLRRAPKPAFASAD
jgi:ArsR family transcriptional regulator, arsenate/arsenite/antimonite-responsive transcriptional repressor